MMRLGEAGPEATLKQRARRKQPAGPTKPKTYLNQKRVERLRYMVRAGAK
jgi:hypothetical protein